MYLCAFPESSAVIQHDHAEHQEQSELGKGIISLFIQQKDAQKTGNEYKGCVKNDPVTGYNRQ